MNTESIIAAFRDWFGISADYAIRGFAFRSSLPPMLFVALACAGAVFACYLYWQEKTMPAPLRILLALFRTVIYALILLILFEPVVSLEKKLSIRRNMLVLVDRSESMGITDARGKQEDIVDAALAAGKAKFVLPEVQEFLARAQVAMRRSADALREGRSGDAMDAQREAEERLATALKGSDAAAAGNKSVEQQLAGRLAGISQGIRDVAGLQKGLRESAEKLEKEGTLDANRRRGLMDSQVEVLKALDRIFTTIRETPVEITAQAQAQVASISRLAQARGLIEQPSVRVLDKIAAECKMRYYSFGDKLEPVETGSTNSTVSMAPTAKTTRGGEAIEEAVARDSGQSIAGVVVLTDGAFNEGNDPLGVARRMKEQGVPLFMVGFGLEAPQDVGLRSLIVQNVIFPKDKLTARVQVFARGYPGAAAEVRLLLDNAELAKVPVELSDEPRFIEIPFQVPDEKGGLAKLAVTVTALPGEISTANNRIEQVVKIVNQKIKVLYVEGKPRWEYRYLRVVLLRDQRLDVKFLMTQGDEDLARSSPQYLARYPDKPEEAFGFDLVILGDVPSWYFNQGQLERMVQLVRERGGSILMLAGDRYAPASYVDTAIAEILPVRITQDYTPVPATASPVSTVEGRRSFASLEGTEEANNSLWSLVRPIYQVPRLEGAKAAANIMVQLAGVTAGKSEPYPLVSWHYAGTGKTMFIGTDQLWRLRFMRGDRYHAQFWGQTIQFLALSRLLGENKRIRVETDRNVLRAGERLQVFANVLDDSFKPSKAEQYTVRVDRMVGDGQAAGASNKTETAGLVAEAMTVKLSPVAGTPGLYQGACAIKQEGKYLVRAPAEDEKSANSVELLVAASNREQQEPAMQGEVLRKMAELSGGRYIPVREWPTLPGLIQGQDRTVLDQKDKDLWDIWPFYVLFIVLAGAEWFLRRRYRLV